MSSYDNAAAKSNETVGKQFTQEQAATYIQARYRGIKVRQQPKEPIWSYQQHANLKLEIDYKTIGNRNYTDTNQINNGINSRDTSQQFTTSHSNSIDANHTGIQQLVNKTGLLMESKMNEATSLQSPETKADPVADHRHHLKHHEAAIKLQASIRGKQTRKMIENKHNFKSKNTVTSKQTSKNSKSNSSNVQKNGHNDKGSHITLSDNFQNQHHDQKSANVSQQIEKSQSANYNNNNQIQWIPKKSSSNTYNWKKNTTTKSSINETDVQNIINNIFPNQFSQSESQEQEVPKDPPPGPDQKQDSESVPENHNVNVQPEVSQQRTSSVIVATIEIPNMIPMADSQSVSKQNTQSQRGTVSANIINDYVNNLKLILNGQGNDNTVTTPANQGIVTAEYNYDNFPQQQRMDQNHNPQNYDGSHPERTYNRYGKVRKKGGPCRGICPCIALFDRWL